MFIMTTATLSHDSKGIVLSPNQQADRRVIRVDFVKSKTLCCRSSTMYLSVGQQKGNEARGCRILQ